MESKAKVLLAEDDTSLAFVIKDNLEEEHYEVAWCADGESAWQRFIKGGIDICLLDVMMPVKDGFTLAKKIRQKSDVVPILFITAKSLEQDKLDGFKTGADDYITKPFDSEVLLLKIKAILKRNEEFNKESENLEFDLGRYHFNPKLRELAHDGKTQTLSPKENELLKMLAEHKNDLLPRERALKKIWGSDTYFNGRSMDVYIAKLRKYLKDDENIEIVNIHGNGFRLVSP